MWTCVEKDYKGMEGGQSWLYHLHIHSGLEYNIMMCQACNECDMNNT